MRASILIITKNRAAVLPRCLEGLMPQLGSHELVVVDSSENDQTQAIMARYPAARYYRISLPPGTRPQSYSYGARHCRGEVVALLDDDAIPHAGWLDRLLEVYADPRVGAVGGRVISENPDPEARSSGPVGADDVGRVLPTGRIRSHCEYDGPAPIDVDTLRGCNMSVRRRLFETIGYFDARYTGQNCRVEDDLCLRVKHAGYRVVFTPASVVTHLTAERQDVPRASDNPRGVYYVARNTVLLYLKNFPWSPTLLAYLLLINPLVDGARYTLVGGLRRCRGISLPGLRLALINLWGSWVGLAAAAAARAQGGTIDGLSREHVQHTMTQTVRA
jgi:GT2 family glycosyltransferase